jgi:D-serine deaminase-like pyridoxal phosphate-dependent protein
MHWGKGDMVATPIGAAKAELDTPALCLDIEVVERNIQRMAGYFRDRPVKLRPHSKTHKSPVLARMQLAAGAIGITCAKLGEAEVMAQAGIRDILIANQVVSPGKIVRLVNLAAYTDVIVAVDNAGNVAKLSAAAEAKGVQLRVLVEVDIGHGRCGVPPGQPALELARRVMASPGLRLAGLMGYEGHSVMTPDPNERRAQTEASLALLTGTADLLRSQGIPVEIVSSGGTGTYFITGNYPGITELEVGSYITMDRQYREATGIDFEYGLTVLSTVVSARGNDQAICDAGLKALTSDFGMPLVVDPPGWALTGLSEEHGHLARVDGPPLHVGAQVEIVPNHGCTTINLHDTYHVMRRGVLEALWPVAARGRTD